MTSFFDLFTIIEETNEVPGSINLSPDDAIYSAKLALNDKHDLAEALKHLEEQIRKFRQTVLGLSFNVIESIKSEKFFHADKLSRLGTELHQLAAMICMRLNRLQDAREHLMSALACDTHNQDTQFHFVEVYERSGAYLEAFDQLDKTFGDVMIIDRFYRLFELCWNVHRIDPEQAYPIYYKLSNLKEANLLGEIAYSQLSIIKNKVKGLSEDDAQKALKEGVEKRNTGKAKEALTCFFEVLCFYPFHPGAWYFIGDLYLSFLVPSPEYRDNLHLLVDENTEMGESQQVILRDAVQALQMSIISKPMAHTYLLLINCYSLLKDYKNAIKYALMGRKQEPENLQLMGLHALTLFLNGFIDEAAKLAMQIIHLNSSEPSALKALQLIEKLKQKN